MAPLWRTRGGGFWGRDGSDGRTEGKIYGMRRRAVGVKSCGAWTPGSGACWREGIRAKSKIRAGWDQCHDCTITSERAREKTECAVCVKQYEATRCQRCPADASQLQQSRSSENRLQMGLKVRVGAGTQGIPTSVRLNAHQDHATSPCG